MIDLAPRTRPYAILLEAEYFKRGNFKQRQLQHPPKAPKINKKTDWKLHSEGSHVSSLKGG
ncbi:MAG: hypothetical protein ABS58_13765 [Mesorhizobium sp. SCN 65-20]|nr:MAG: hypothetical protein ABS58_13765 [Mesorhizobium sp. SCN 65-20]